MTVVLGILASHQGTAARILVEACAKGTLDARVGVIISNNSGAGILEYARAAGIPAQHIGGKTFEDEAERDAAILDALEASGTELVLLLGYLRLLGPLTLSRFRSRVLNVHPALLPKYGGRGMYREHVHEAVLAAAETESGVTIHLVDEEYDHGPVVAQARVPVLLGDTPESLGKRVQAREAALLIETIDAWIRGGLAFSPQL